MLLAAADYLIRIVIPLTQYVLFFPSIAWLPEYISFFLIGIVAARGEWLAKIPSSMGRRVFVVAIIATLTLFPLTLFSALFGLHLLGGGNFLGSGSFASGIYALWESIFAVGISMFLIVLFRRYFDTPGTFWRYLSQHYYTVYIIHIPILVALTAVVLSSISIGPLLKFALASVIAVPLIWGAAYPVRKIPYAERVM